MGCSINMILLLPLIFELVHVSSSDELEENEALAVFGNGNADSAQVVVGQARSVYGPPEADLECTTLSKGHRSSKNRCQACTDIHSRRLGVLRRNDTHNKEWLQLILAANNWTEEHYNSQLRLIDEMFDGKRWVENHTHPWDLRQMNRRVRYLGRDPNDPPPPNLFKEQMELRWKGVQPGISTELTAKSGMSILAQPLPLHVQMAQMEDWNKPGMYGNLDHYKERDDRGVIKQLAKGGTPYIKKNYELGSLWGDPEDEYRPNKYVKRAHKINSKIHYSKLKTLIGRR